MNNLGNIYVKMGDFSRSETNLLAALSLKAELFGKSNLDYLSTVQNLTALYLDYSFPDKALVYFREAFTKIDTSEEKISHELYWLLNNYGNYFYDIKDYEKGKVIHEKVLRMRQKSFGLIHPDCAVSIGNLAYYYQVKKDYDKAIELKVRSDSILDAWTGRTSGVARSKIELSELYLLAKQPLKARDALLTANTIQNKDIKYSANFLSETQLQNYIKTFSKNLDNILSYNLETDNIDTLYRLECMNSIILFKGFVLNLSRMINKVVVSSHSEASW
ncbi:MAG: tetratricopeptide repeat protein [Saprospiraceae bacterium]|nr:tetratricopeptide repeat protein [Saprospiraceae bacterium]